MKKKYAIVGTGSRVRLYIDGLCNQYKEQGDLIAICDTNQIRMDYHKNFILRKFSSNKIKTYHPNHFEKMIKDNKIEVVIVTSIDCTHHLYIASAMKLGCDVITEKPLTTQISYCDFIFKAIKDYEKKLTVTFNYRYTPRNAKIKELLTSGIIGEVKSIHFEWFLDTSHGADYFRRWHRDKRNSGGLMIHKASHHFDLVNWWINSKPISVYGNGDLVFYGKKNAEERGIYNSFYRATGSAGAKRDPFALDLSSGLLESLYLNAEDEDGYLRDLNVFGDGISIEDDMSLIVKYASGTTMTYHLTAYSPCEGFRIAFNGTKGRIDYFVEESSYVSGSVKDKNTPSKSFKTENNSKNQIIIRPHWEESYEIKMPPEELSGHGGGDKRMLEDIFANKNKDNFRQIADHRDGAYAFLVGLAANESFRLNLPINISRHYFENYTVKYLNETTYPLSNLSL